MLGQRSNRSHRTRSYFWICRGFSYLNLLLLLLLPNDDTGIVAVEDRYGSGLENGHGADGVPLVISISCGRGGLVEHDF